MAGLSSDVAAGPSAVQQHPQHPVLLGAVSPATPALSLYRRLQACAEVPPSWASYLPQPLRAATQSGDAFSATALPSPPSCGSPDASAVGILGSPALARANASMPTCSPSAKPSLGGFGGSLGGNDCEPQPQIISAAPPALPFGHVWTLARDAHGCREVQSALEGALREEDRVALAKELQGHVWDAMRCPHANYVLQKCIALLRPYDLQFIIDEIVKKGDRAIAQAARHKYGCRIIQRLLEHCSTEQVNLVAAALLGDAGQAVTTARHPYGNYVMQHLLEHGSQEQRSALTRHLAAQAAVVGGDEFACAVVGKAMAFGEHVDQVSLARALMKVPGIVSCMARTRHGHVAARRVLQALEGEEQDEARGQLHADAAALRNSRYGRLVIGSIDGAGGSPAMPHSPAA